MTSKQLLKPQQLHDYQQECVMHQLKHNDSMLWLQMGLGKTPITLTTIVDRMRSGQVKKTLIFGPLRVIQAVWAREAKKWEHTQHLRFSVLHGPKDKRTRALFADADVYLCNYEGMNWLAETLDHYYISQGKPIPFQMVVYDEVSKLKNSTTKRMKGGTRDRRDKWDNVHKIKMTGWRKIVDHFKFRTGLTGTPSSNGYMDLHGQYLAVDGGERLGEFITHFKDSYFTSDHMGWKYTPSDIGKKMIEQKIHDITIKMDSADYLDMPDVKITNLLVDLPPKARKAYEDVEKQLFTALDNGTEIEVFSKSAVSNKCLQFCLAEGTEVLTDSGWKPIEQFQQGDKVWDGIEWVSVYSLAFQGRKNVVELDGVWMTPDHKVLTNSGWKEAKDILNGDDSERFNRSSVRIPDCFTPSRVDNREAEKSIMVSTVYMWQRIRSYWSEPSQPKQTWCEVMRLSSRGNHTECDRFTRDDEHTSVYNVDQHAVTMSESKGQGLPELRGSWYSGVRRMVRVVRSVLERHEGRVSGSSNDRTIEQRRSLLCGELSMGDSEQTVEQQKKQHIHHDTVGSNDGDASCKALRVQGRDTVCSTTERVEGKRPVVTTKVEKTYDLINAGKRNRFTVRGVNGEVFIAHNCNGSPYENSESDKFEPLHDAKLDALEDILEEAGGKPVLCSYSFKADAERIMKRFKKYNPVNMTASRSADTEKIINKWNNGQIKLMIGHPACLHPDTLVLTERNGWTKLIDVTRDDRVHDGVEFVSHSGCSYSGYKDVIDVFGVTMTHNHKLLIGGEWKEAKDVGNSRDTKREALYEYEGDDEYLSEMLPMWGSVEDTSSECNEAQSDEANPLSPLCSRPIPQHDWNSNLAYMARDEEPRQGSIGQELRGSWDRCLRGMGRLRNILCRYVTDLRGSSDNRTCECEQGLFERQLHMGNSVRSTGEQAHNKGTDVSGFRDSSSRVMSSNWNKQDETHHAIESGNDSRRSSNGRDELTLREKLEAEEQSEKGCKKEHVYDLVDCGPRHRFLIKNSDGEVFISHNSMGHGVDGLQDTGSIVVWFGCNWSLELYEQMNARIDRQGQTKPVSIIRIICADTVDLAVVDALERKADDQEGLKNALERYRKGITTNELEVNFF